jgi:hypothetical protein
VSTDNTGRKPDWDETPVTLNVVQDILDAHPEYTLTSHRGPDGRRYMMIQFFDEEPNHQANSDFVSFVSELGNASVDTEIDE